MTSVITSVTITDQSIPGPATEATSMLGSATAMFGCLNSTFVKLRFIPVPVESILGCFILL